MKKKSKFSIKSTFAVAEEQFILEFDLGDIYLREDVVFEKDLDECMLEIRLNLEEFYQIERYKTFEIKMKYYCPDIKEINEHKINKNKNYGGNLNNYYYVDLFKFNQETKILNICEDFWWGRELWTIQYIIKRLINLEKIYFIGRYFLNKRGEDLSDHEDDEVIRNTYNNPNWEDEHWVHPHEDEDDLTHLVFLRKQIDEKMNPKIKIEFEYLPDESFDLLNNTKLYKILINERI
jgi:hypothetical protein